MPEDNPFENPGHIHLHTKVMASANRALLSAVTKNLRAITVDYNNDCLVWRGYFDKGATAHDKALIDIALSEMIADLWQDIRQFRFEPVDVPFPGKMDKLKDWIYLRDENPEG